MISMYEQQGQGLVALQLFEEMKREGVEPNKVTLVCILDACASCAALTEGKQADTSIANSGYLLDNIVGTALINMYGKCGSLDDVWRIFEEIPERNVVLWTAMIAVHAQHGLGKQALELFGQMQAEGTQPDKVTFVSILAACSHAGLITEGCRCFVSMIQDFYISPIADHYVCLVDLLGRAGRLDEAEILINFKPVHPTLASYLALLGACRYQGDVQRGERVAKHVLELDLENTASHIMLSHVYAVAGITSDAYFTEVNDCTHELIIDD